MLNDNLLHARSWDTNLIKSWPVFLSAHMVVDNKNNFLSAYCVCLYPFIYILLPKIFF